MFNFCVIALIKLILTKVHRGFDKLPFFGTTHQSVQKIISYFMAGFKKNFSNFADKYNKLILVP